MKAANLVRFLPAVAVVAALSVFAYGVHGDSKTGPVKGQLATQAAARAATVEARASAAEARAERPRLLPSLPRASRRARVLPHVAQIFAEILTPQEVSLAPGVIAANMTFAGLLTGVLAFGDHLVEPIEAYLIALARRVFRRKHALEPKKAHPKAVAGVTLVLAMMALTALMQTFLSSGDGIFGDGGLFVFATLLGAAILLSAVAEAVRYAVARRHRLQAHVEIRPTGLVIAGGTVVFSRAANLVPGLLLGRTGGVQYEKRGPEVAGRLALAGLLAMAIAGLAAWAASFAIPQIAGGAAGGHAQDFALGLYFAATQAVVFATVPAAGSTGAAIWKWQPKAWLLVALPASFLLFHTVLNPAGSFLDATQSANAPLYIAIAGVLCAVPAIPRPKTRAASGQLVAG